MCILLIAYGADPEYPLIIAANRDEAYRRPAMAAHWWEDGSGILAGRDLRAGGTWLGVSRDGRFAAITNHWGTEPPPAGAPSRGVLVRNYLSGGMSGMEYMKELKSSGELYAGFNLIFGTVSGLYYFHNSGGGNIGALKKGVHAVSNEVLDTPWPKVVTAKSMLTRMISEKRVSGPALFDLLNLSEEAELQKNGDLPEDQRRRLSRSSIRVCFPVFGTRSSTVVLCRGNGTLGFMEKNYYPPGIVRFSWNIGREIGTLH